MEILLHGRGHWIGLLDPADVFNKVFAGGLSYMLSELTLCPGAVLCVLGLLVLR